MKSAIALLKAVAHDERGTTAIEYVVIAAVIAIAIFGAVGLVGNGISGLFTAASDTAANAMAAQGSALN